MRLYIIRHADPDYENNTITPAGHLEAQALARRLCRQGLDRIYTSPMNRAVHTMKYTADLMNMKAEVLPWTEEIYFNVEVKPWGRLTMADVPGEIIREREPYFNSGHWYTEPPFTDAPGFIDKYQDIRRASDEFLGSLGYEREGGRYRCTRPNRLQVAVFCHMAFGLTWLSMLLELPLPLVYSGFWLAPSSVSTILFEERSDSWAVPRCLGLGDVSHLYEAGLPVSRRGLMANHE